MQGSVRLAEAAARRGLFRESPKPLALLHETITITDGGKFPEGQTEIPFEAEVKGIDGMVRSFFVVHKFFQRNYFTALLFVVYCNCLYVYAVCILHATRPQVPDGDRQGVG